MVRFSTNKKRPWLGQPQLIKSLKKKFNNKVKKVQSHKTPSTPLLLCIWMIIIRFLQRTKSFFGVRFQTHYCQCNQRTLRSKQRSAFHELLQVIRYVLNANNLGLKLEPTVNPGKESASVIAIMWVIQLAGEA